MDTSWQVKISNLIPGKKITVRVVKHKGMGCPERQCNLHPWKAFKTHLENGPEQPDLLDPALNRIRLEPTSSIDPSQPKFYDFQRASPNT